VSSVLTTCELKSLMSIVGCGLGSFDAHLGNAA
jgi:hypothetical protein